MNPRETWAALSTWIIAQMCGPWRTLTFAESPKPWMPPLPANHIGTRVLAAQIEARLRELSRRHDTGVQVNRYRIRAHTFYGGHGLDVYAIDERTGVSKGIAEMAEGRT